MTIEEKAKAYDEAIDKIGDVVEAGTIEQGLAEWLFPKLKENENEQSKKWILEYLYDGLRKSDEQFKDQFKSAITWLKKQGKKPNNVYDKELSEILGHVICRYINDPNIPYTEREKISEEIIPYVESLEKQGEQKPFYKIEPRFNVGDWITNGRYIEHIIGINQDWPYYMFEDGTTKRIKDIDKKYRLWTIQDAKDGDVLYSLDSFQPFIYKERKSHEQATAYCGINKYGKFFVWNNKYCIITLDKYVPSTKEQRDTLFKKMKEAGYEWDVEKKELKKTYVIDEGKDEIDYCFTKMMKGEKVTPAWSEEDETKLTTAQTFIRNTSLIGNDEIKEATIDWLKSLKDRVRLQDT